jgi:hypothetical protein
MNETAGACICTFRWKAHTEFLQAKFKKKIFARDRSRWKNNTKMDLEAFEVDL